MVFTHRTWVFSGVSIQCWGFSPRSLYSGRVGTPVSSQDSFLLCLLFTCLYINILGHGQGPEGNFLHRFQGLFFCGSFFFSTLPVNFSYCSRCELWSLLWPVRLLGSTSLHHGLENASREKGGSEWGFIPYIPPHTHHSPVLFTIYFLKSIISRRWFGFSLWRVG